MSPKIKNIIIFVGILVVVILIYAFFFKSAPKQASLTSSTGALATVNPASQNSSANSTVAQDFLALLLNVRSIKLNDDIFTDSTFGTLNDSTIELVSDPANEGRPNPFAPIGSEGVAATPPVEGGATPPPATTPPATTTPPANH